MSDNPFESPEWLQLAAAARESLEPIVRDSAVAISLYSGSVDPKLALELGYMVLLDKPIIAVVSPGAKAPAKLIAVADEILELAPDDPSFAERLTAVARRYGVGTERQEE